MSHFYDDDEKDYYRGDAWGGSSMKSIYESSTRDKFTLPEDDDVSPSFGGSYRLKRHTVPVTPAAARSSAAAPPSTLGGAPQKASLDETMGGTMRRAPRKPRVSIRGAFGGNPATSSSTSDSDISLADLIDSNSESDVSESDVKEVKEKHGGAPQTKKLSKYQEAQKTWRYRGNDNLRDESPTGGRYHNESPTGGRYRDNRTGRFQAVENPHGGRRDKITDSEEEEESRPYGIGRYLHSDDRHTHGGAFTFNFGGNYEFDSDGMESLH